MDRLAFHLSAVCVSMLMFYLFVVVLNWPVWTVVALGLVFLLLGVFIGKGKQTMKLNLGCSDRLKPGCVNVDRWRPDNADGSFQQADLSMLWPWPDSSVTEIIADDIIEHLPDKIQTMNEIHRVLVPGGLAHIFVPTTDGRGAWQDPTHISYWNRNSFWYYTRGVAEYERFHKSYGITGCFTVVKEEMAEYPGSVSKLIITLAAVK